MAIKSRTKRAEVKTNSLVEVLVNNEPYASYYIGQIDIVNASAADIAIDVSIVSGGTAYMLLHAVVQRGWSRMTDERKIPYELKPGEKLAARLSQADSAGMIVHVSYIGG